MIDRGPKDCPSVSAQANDPDKRLWLIATGVTGGIATLATAVPWQIRFEKGARGGKIDE